MLLVLSLALFAGIGFIAGRFFVLALPLLIWGFFFAGVAAGWWGNGFGEAWTFALALTLAGSVSATAAGVGFRRVLDAYRGGEQ